MAFDAFISYSHAADGRMAPALQRAIQRLAKPWYRPRALRVFRDESALTANPHLWSSIQTAMDEAEWFVLLASPDAVASEWVNREISHWLSNKSAGRILAVVTDGTWEWDASAHALTGTAVPEALRGAFADEPRHVDLRWAATETDLDMHHSRFRDVVAQLAAPMHGMAKDELDSEDVRQHRRAQRLARGGVTALTLLVVISLVFGTISVVERNRANHNATRANEATDAATARGLASASARALDAAKPELALLLGAESHRFAVQSRSSAAAVAKTDESLLAAVGAESPFSAFLAGQGDPCQVAYSSDGSLVACAARADLRVWDARTRQPLAHQPSPVAGRPITSLAVNRDRVLATGDASGYVRLWDLRANAPWHWQPPRRAYPKGTAPPYQVASVALSDNGMLAVTSPRPGWPILLTSSTVRIWDINTGRRVGAITLSGQAVQVAFAPDGKTLAVRTVPAENQPQTRSAVQMIDVATRAFGQRLEGQPFPTQGPSRSSYSLAYSLAFSPDGSTLTSVQFPEEFGLIDDPTEDAAGSIVAWNLVTGHRLPTFAPTLDATHHLTAASPDADEVAVEDTTNGTTTVFDSRGRDITELHVATALDADSLSRIAGTGAQSVGISATFDPTGRTFALATASGAIALSDPGAPSGAAAWMHTHSFTTDPAVTWLESSPDARFLAGVEDPRGPRTVRGPRGERLHGVNVARVEILDTKSGKPRSGEPGLDALEVANVGTITSPIMAFGADDSLAIWTPTGLVVWDTVHARVAARLGGVPSSCLPSAGASGAIGHAFNDAIVQQVTMQFAGSAATGHITLQCSTAKRAFLASWKLGAATKPQWTRSVASATELVLSPDGSSLLTAEPQDDYGSWSLRDAATYRRRASVAVDAGLATFSPDGRTFVVPGAPSMSLVDSRTGSVLRTLAVPPPWLLGPPVFSPDGRLVVALVPNMLDRLGLLPARYGVAVWDVATGELVGQLAGLNGDVVPYAPNAGFGANGRQLTASGSVAFGPIHDGVSQGSERWTIETWSFGVDDWTTAACNIANRNLTREEWSEFVGPDVPYEKTCPQWPAGS